MNIEEKIRGILLTYPAVTALVGTADAARIRTDDLDETDKLPAIVVAVQSEDHEETLDATQGFANTVVTVTCRDWTRQGSRALAAAVQAGGLNSYDGPDFGAFVDSVRTDAVDPGDGSDRWWYDTVLSLTLLYAE